MEVLEGAETTLLRSGFGKRLVARSTQITLYRPIVEFTLQQPLEEVILLKEWRYNIIPF